MFDDIVSAKAEISRLNVSLANACEHHNAMGSELRELRADLVTVRAECERLHKNYIYFRDLAKGFEREIERLRKLCGDAASAIINSGA